MLRRNVLRVNDAEERTRYREAVAESLRTVMVDHGVTLLEIAEQIGVSLGTISNAANKKADLTAVYLGRLGAHYGASAIDPFARIMGGRFVPLEPDASGDVLPFITLASYRVSQARSPASPGGTAETLTEQLDMLPDLRRLYRELGAAIAQIEARKAAA
jgi:transcriptional regulator with XRE-family HTH domain